MNILLVPDKFKGSLSGEEVISALKNGIAKVLPKAHVVDRIISDGGDGFLDAVAKYVNVEEVMVSTEDPLGRSIVAPLLIDSQNSTAYIELAKASGIALLKITERSTLKTSTKGTGILIAAAIERGIEKIYVGLGGSATTDGGIGIAEALGYTFLDTLGNQLAPIGENLKAIDKIVRQSKFNPIEICAVNDVNNPLFGITGAAYVYGPQKGASQEAVNELDEGLQNLATVVKTDLNKNGADIPGAGAAGGTAFGLQAFMEAQFINGIDFIINISKIEELLNKKKFDLIITGEGKIDDQTTHGKLIQGIAKLGNNYKIPTIAVCGANAMSTSTETILGLTEVIEVQDRNQSLVYNMANATTLIENAIVTFLKHNKKLFKI